MNRQHIWIMGIFIIFAFIVGYVLGQPRLQGPGHGYYEADDYFIPTATFSSSYTPSLDKLNEQLKGPQCVEPTQFIKITE